MSTPLSPDEKQYLLELARASIVAAVNRQPAPALDFNRMTEALRAEGASFVTLTEQGNLRGCIGALEAYQPLAEDVREHAAAAATQDYRFPPVAPDELPGLAIEISRLTAAVPLVYTDSRNLLEKLQPGIDGVILRDGFRRATFLPQVWEKLPDKEEFLANLCYKMGASPDTWRKKHLEVLTYQVEEFHE